MQSSPDCQFDLPSLDPFEILGRDPELIAERGPMAEVHTARTFPATSPTLLPSPAIKPKRPLSAYNLFFHLERKKILEQATPGDPEIGFRDMARVIANRWKNVDSKYKMELTGMAKEDKVRYHMAMRRYHRQLADEAEQLQRHGDVYEEEFEQNKKVLMLPMLNGKGFHYDTAMRTKQMQLQFVDRAALLVHQDDSQQERHFASTKTKSNEVNRFPPVQDEMQKQPLFPWEEEKILYKCDLMTPTSLLRDSSVAALAQHLDDDMTRMVIDIFS